MRSLLGFVTCAALLAVIGCGSPEAPTSAYCTSASCNSPSGVLQNLELALANRDLAEMDSLLTPDFSIAFPGGLVNEGPDSLPREGFLKWLGGKFRNPTVASTLLNVHGGFGQVDSTGNSEIRVQSGSLSVSYSTGNGLRDDFQLRQEFTRTDGRWRLARLQGDSSRTSFVLCSTPACHSWAWTVSRMALAFNRRSASDYVTLLDSGYVFRFIPDLYGNSDSLIAPQEIAFARHLFETGSTDGTQPPAAKISLTLDTLSSFPDKRLGHSRWIRVFAQTSLVLLLPDGNQTPISSPAYFFFRLTDSGEWKLAEWQDVQTSASSSVGRDDHRAPLGSRPLGWGALRKRYR